jgi:hypothetical protein
MPRQVTIPAETIYEDIQSLNEYPEQEIVRVVVGSTDSEGVFLVPQQFNTYEIQGDMYTELVGPPTSWAPDKPDGTYRNEDLWHFIDLLRGE